MARLDKHTTNDLVKLVIFLVITTLATSLLVITIGNISFSGTKQYQGRSSPTPPAWSRATTSGSQGSRSARVKEVEIVDQTRALVTFTVEESTAAQRLDARLDPLPQPGRPALHLADPGRRRHRGVLDDGDTIPVERTSPALDLTVLFNGFKPLFQALSPDDINKLSYEIVQVFQGEGGTLESLLGHTASITQTLADRDAVIGDLIDNLDFVLEHVADRDDQLSSLITNFRDPGHGPEGRPRGDPELARRHLRAVRADRRSGQGHPGAVRRGHQAAAPLRRQHRQEQGRARPGPAGAADQAQQDRADGDLRFVVQLLPVRVQGPRDAARQHHTVPIDYTVGAERCDLG